MIHVLAIDLGASGGRVIRGSWDAAERRISLQEIHRFANEPVELQGTLYWDVLRLFHEIKAGIREAVRQLPAGETIACLGIDTWGVDFGLLDGHGQLLGNPVHYRDRRTDGMVALVSAELGEGSLFRATGIQDAWFNTVYQLMGLRLSDPALLAGADCLLFMPDLLNYFLTGLKAAERTIASTSQLLAAGLPEWDDQIFRRLELPRRLVLPVAEPGTILGPVTAGLAAELGLAPATPVALVPSHDTESAALAVPAMPETGESFAFVSCGTWSVLGAELQAPVLSENCRLAGFSNEAGSGGTYCLLRNIMGMWLLQECGRWWERDGLKLDHAELARLAAEAPSWQHFIDVNHQLFAQPGDMPLRIRAYCRVTGQAEPEGKAALLRCVIESLACCFRESLTVLEELSGKHFATLWLVGGGSRNSLLCSTTASLIGRPVTVGPTETTALGNVMSQLQALGELLSVPAVRAAVATSFATQVHAVHDTTTADTAFKRWKALTSKAPAQITAGLGN